MCLRDSRYFATTRRQKSIDKYKEKLSTLSITPALKRSGINTKEIPEHVLVTSQMLRLGI